MSLHLFLRSLASDKDDDKDDNDDDDDNDDNDDNDDLDDEGVMDIKGYDGGGKSKEHPSARISTTSR